MALSKDIKKLTKLQESFCRIYQKNEFIDPTKCYRMAFNTPDSTLFATSSSASSRLLAKPYIQEYLNHLEEELKKSHRVSMGSLLNDLVKSKDRSVKKKDEKQVVSAINSISRLLGISSGNNPPFIIRECKDYAGTMREEKRLIDDYSGGYISKQQQEVAAAYLRELKNDFMNLEYGKDIDEIKIFMKNMKN